MCTQCVCSFLSLVSGESLFFKFLVRVTCTLKFATSEDALIAFSPLCDCNFLSLAADESGGWTMCFVFVFVFVFCICICAISCSRGLVEGGLVEA